MKKSENTGRRGRKKGDGVLKEIDPHDSGWAKRLQLAYGRTYNDRIAEAVRWFRNWRSMADDYQKSGDESRRQFVESRTKDFADRLTQQMMNALWAFEPDFFQQMADAIALEKEAMEAYPLHNALLTLAGVPTIQRADTVYPERSHQKLPNVSKAEYTISEICKLLEKQGDRPKAYEHDDNAFQVVVRRACDQLHIPYLPDKPGRKPNKILAAI